LLLIPHQGVPQSADAICKWGKAIRDFRGRSQSQIEITYTACRQKKPCKKDRLAGKV